MTQDLAMCSWIGTWLPPSTFHGLEPGWFSASIWTQENAAALGLPYKPKNDQGKVYVSVSCSLDLDHRRGNAEPKVVFRYV